MSDDVGDATAVGKPTETLGITGLGIQTSAPLSTQGEWIEPCAIWVGC